MQELFGTESAIELTVLGFPTHLYNRDGEIRTPFVGHSTVRFCCVESNKLIFGP